MTDTLPPPFPWDVQLMAGNEVFDTRTITSLERGIAFKKTDAPYLFTACRIFAHNGEFWKQVKLSSELRTVEGITPLIELASDASLDFADDIEYALTREERQFLFGLLARFPFEYRRRALVDSILRKLDRL